MKQKQSSYDCSETHPACRLLRNDSRNSGVNDPDNLPFMFCPQEPKVAALLVHGFTATPWEMRPLAEFLADAGIASLAIRLPGHGTTPEDLAARRWQEWRASVEKGYRILAHDFASVFGMGMSTGSLLLLASHASCRFKGLTLFSPYLRIQHALAPYARWLRWFMPYHKKYIGEDHQSRYYSHRPVAGIHQINLLIKTVRKELKNICCPVMAFNGEGDQTIDVQSSSELMSLLGSQVKIHEIFGPDVNHVLTGEQNPCRWSMFAQSAYFVQELTRPKVHQRVK